MDASNERGLEDLIREVSPSFVEAIPSCGEIDAERDVIKCTPLDNAKVKRILDRVADRITKATIRHQVPSVRPPRGRRPEPVPPPIPESVEPSLSFSSADHSMHRVEPMDETHPQAVDEREYLPIRDSNAARGRGARD